MFDGDDSKSFKTRPSSGSRSNGDQSPTAKKQKEDGSEQSELYDSQSVGGHVQRTGGLSSSHAKRNSEEIVDVDSEIYDAEPITPSQLTHTFSTWSSPYPPPEVLAEFKRIDPEFANRAFIMAEQSVEASNLEKTTLARGDVDAISRGQWLSFLAVVLFLLAAIVLYAISGKVILASLALASPAFQYLGKLIRTVRSDENGRLE